LLSKKVKLIFLAVFLVILVGCQSAKDHSKKMSIATTFYPIYEFTKAVVGDLGEVSMLLPAGVEPHEYDPSAKELAEIMKKKVLVYNSKYLETWVTKNKSNFSSTQVTLIEASSKVDLLPLSHHQNCKNNFDPHTWLSPKKAVKEVEYIRDALIRKFPQQKSKLKLNAQKYLTKLIALDREYCQALRDVKQKKFVTQHPAFSYLANDYQLEQETITNLSAQEEPSAKRLAELKRYIAKNRITAIYFETNASSKVAQILAKESNVKTLVLNPLEVVTKEQQKQGQDYLSIMRENLKSLKQTVK
jgi:zinc transport system substrate-binding protein